jgi:hypothetical protein
VAARRTRASTACGRRAPGQATRHAACGRVLPSRAHGQAARPPHGAAGLARDSAKRVHARADRRAGDVALADWLAEGRFPGFLVSRGVFLFLLRFSESDFGFAPVHAPRVRFSPGSLLHRLGEVCPTLFTCEPPLRRSVGP